MYSKSFASTVVLGMMGLFLAENVAHAQRGRGYPVPIGYRPPSVVTGLGYSTRYIYPTYDAFSAGTRGFAVDPVGLSYPPAPVTATQETHANIRVLVPDPEAKVWFDGILTTSKGRDRLYHTPPLAPVGSYSYRIRAAWMAKGEEMIQEQVVSVSPGRTSVADFTRPVPDDSAAPK